jgi:predicted acyltransferase
MSLDPVRPAAVPPAFAPGGRLVSLDAFRGCTMFWLMGGKAFVAAVAGLLGLEFVRYQLAHSAWEGLRYYDLIWPSFMLMVGMAVPFAFAGRREQSPGEWRRGVWRRAAILFLLGSLRESLSAGAPRLIELSSALQPIAIAYLVTAHLAGRSVRLQAGVAAGVLVGYALLLASVGAAGIPAGTYEMNRNLVTTFDEWVIGRAHKDGWGTALSTIPTVATSIVGLILGQVLREPSPPQAKLKVLALTGAGCLAAGYGLSPVVPIIMKLWTTSYGLVATGWACVFFSVFYWVTDVRGWRAWAFPFGVIGVNALAAYLLGTLLPVSRTAGIFTKPVAPLLGAFGPVLTTGAVLLSGWLILFWLYRKKIYLRP